MRLSGGLAVGPLWIADIPTKICKLLVDSLKSHISRSVRILQYTSTESGCERKCEMLLYVGVSCMVIGSGGCKISQAFFVSVYSYGLGHG